MGAPERVGDQDGFAGEGRGVSQGKERRRERVGGPGRGSRRAEGRVVSYGPVRATESLMGTGLARKAGAGP